MFVFSVTPAELLMLRLLSGEGNPLPGDCEEVPL